MRSVVLPMLEPQLPPGPFPELVTRGLSPRATEMLGTPTNLRGLLEGLRKHGLSRDALRVLTRVLPQRAVIAWAAACFSGLAHDETSLGLVEREALDFARGWLESEAEQLRSAAAAFAERGRYRCAGHWLAAAVGWTGGSLAPGDISIPPPSSLVGEAAQAALISLAAETEGPSEVLRAFVDRALLSYATPPAATAT